MDKLRILVVGHSHIAALKRGWSRIATDNPHVRFDFMNLRHEQYFRVDDKNSAARASVPDEARMDLILRDFSAAAEAAQAVLFCLNGNEHNNLGMFKASAQAPDHIAGVLGNAVRDRYSAWLRHLAPRLHLPGFVVFPPPPVEDGEFILNAPAVQQLSRTPELRAAHERLRFWQVQCQVIEDVARTFRLSVVPLPADVVSASGFLHPACCQDVTHGNEAYGTRVLSAVIAHIPGGGDSPPKKAAATSGHPYSELPDYMFWKRSVGQAQLGQLDPVVEPPFAIGITDKVATAGSCFAQHISKRLRNGGFQFLVTETARDQAANGSFHDFSARYGNVYTARQLLQLFDRAFGYFTPLDQVWQTDSGRYCDPFRPTIEADGYDSAQAVLDAGWQHLKAVKEMFEALDVFVFTLGLTECWVSRLDGAAYPLAPGVAGGRYDPQRHSFVNFTAAEVVADMTAFIRKLRVVNPAARVILTVSPVPLAATHVAGQHVLVSTFHSKAILRVAAHEVCSSHNDVYYFPSYEIIMAGDGDRSYFAPDRRTVREEGVDHVMRVFMSRMTKDNTPTDDRDHTGRQTLQGEIEALNEALCDEEMLDR